MIRNLRESDYDATSTSIGRINATRIIPELLKEIEEQMDWIDIELEDYEHNEINVSDEYIGQCIDITDITKATLVKLLKEIKQIINNLPD